MGGKITELFENFTITLKELVAENTKLTIAIAATLMIMILLALGNGMVQSEKEAKLKKESAMYPLPVPKGFEPVEEFFPPQEENLTEDYYYTREQTSQWQDEEFDRWFTVPSESAVEELGKANNKIADEITGAAP